MSVVTLVEVVEGAGEGAFEEVDGVCIVGCDAAPSGALIDTFGMSAFAVVGRGAPDFLAPGGMYALDPRTTAPYLDDS